MTSTPTQSNESHDPQERRVIKRYKPEGLLREHASVSTPSQKGKGQRQAWSPQKQEARRDGGGLRSRANKLLG